MNLNFWPDLTARKCETIDISFCVFSFPFFGSATLLETRTNGHKKWRVDGWALEQLMCRHRHER